MPFLRLLFVVLVAYPVVLLWLGVQVRHRERLPLRKAPPSSPPTTTATSIFSRCSRCFRCGSIPNIAARRRQPIISSKAWWLRWFAKHVIGIIPVVRGGTGQPHEPDPLEGLLPPPWKPVKCWSYLP